MKKKYYVIYVLALACLCASCGKTADVSDTSIETTAQETSAAESMTEATETTEEISSEVTETEYTRTQEAIDAAWEARLDVEEPEMPVIGFDKTDEGFAAVTESGDDKLGDIVVLSPYLNRYDGRVISSNNASFTSDGKKIETSDVIADMDAYLSVIPDLVDKQYDSKSKFLSVNTSKEDLIEIYKDSANLECVFTADALVLCCTDFSVSLPYEEYADIIKAEYLPGNGTSVELCYGLPCEYYPDGVDTENMDIQDCNSFKVNNYNGRDYVCNVIRYIRTGGDESTPDDYYVSYNYVLIFDVTDGNGDNAKIVYEKEYDEIPTDYYYADFVSNLENS